MLKHRFNWGWGAPKAGSLGGGDTGTGVGSDWPQTGGKSVLRNSTHPGRLCCPSPWETPLPRLGDIKLSVLYFTATAARPVAGHPEQSLIPSLTRGDIYVH